MRRPFAPNPGRRLSAQVRHYLGLTQEELSLYLDVTRNRVADDENVGTFSGRPLTSAASFRLTWLWALLPAAEVQAFAQAPPAAPPLAPPAPALPIAAPPLLPADSADLRLLRLEADIAGKQAQLLRWALEARTARAAYLTQVHRHVQAVAAAFADPPAAALALRQAVPESAYDAELTAFLRNRLTRRAAAPVRLGPDLTPRALARDQLRLYLLETEAATLASWLAE